MRACGLLAFCINDSREVPAPLSSLLKKGTGSEHTRVESEDNVGREVPVPLFQQAANRLNVFHHGPIAG